MYKVSLINRTIMNNNSLIVVIPEHTKYFELNEDASKYSAYLIETKNIEGFMPDIEYFELTQNLDISELKRNDALSKLTEEERRILGINIL